MTMLTIEPGGYRVGIEENETLLDAIRKVDQLRFEAPCNGRGTCGKCRVRALSGSFSDLSASEIGRLPQKEREEGTRLACCTTVTGEEAVIELFEKKEKAVVLADAAYHRSVKVPLFSGINDAPYGIAVDIGTTTVAAVLLDLRTGDTLARTSAINPQTEVGGDVLSRIAYTIGNAPGLKKCQTLIVEALNRMTRDMLCETGLAPSEIRAYTVAANCTMLHLLLGVDPESLSRAPFTPVFVEGQERMAHEIGLLPENTSALLYCLPSVSAYIGADIVAGIYMSKIDRTDKNIMFIDIGTNGEIVLSRGGQLYACSCAAGPAMEGMNIVCGMRAAEGAVETVSAKDGRVAIGVIGGTEPVGLCGSGVLESVSMLLSTDSINPSGRLTPKKTTIPEAYYEEGKEKGYYLDRAHGIRFTQGDVRQIQLAKGAILSGFCALMERSGLTFEDLDEVMIAGQFGAHLKAETLADIGILPGETRNKVTYIGNTSLGGAISVMLDDRLTAKYESIRSRVDYMELGTYKGYNDLFVKCLSFPK